MDTGGVGSAPAGAGAGLGAGAGIGGGSNLGQGRVVSGRTSPISNTSGSASKIGYLVNIPFYYSGAENEVGDAISDIWKLIRDNSTFQTERNFKVLIGLNRKVGASSSDSFDQVREGLRMMADELDEEVVDYALVRYEWSPIEDRPVDGAVNYTAIRNRLFKHKKNNAFYEKFKSEGINHIYYLAMDPDTQLDTTILDSVESKFLGEKSPVIVAGHYQFEVENTKLMQADQSRNWPGFLTSIHTKCDQKLKQQLERIKLYSLSEGCLGEADIAQEDYIRVLRNIRILLFILGRNSLNLTEEKLCKKCLNNHQTLGEYQRLVQQSTLLCRNYLSQLVEVIDGEDHVYFEEILSRLPKPNRWEESSTKDDLQKHKFKAFEWTYKELMECMLVLSDDASYNFSEKENERVQKIKDESQIVLTNLAAISEGISQVNESLLALSPALRSLKASIEIEGSEVLYPPEPAIFVKLYQKVNESAVAAIRAAADRIAAAVADTIDFTRAIEATADVTFDLVDSFTAVAAAVGDATNFIRTIADIDAAAATKAAAADRARADMAFAAAATAADRVSITDVANIRVAFTDFLLDARSTSVRHFAAAAADNFTHYSAAAATCAAVADTDVAARRAASAARAAASAACVVIIRAAAADRTIDFVPTVIRAARAAIIAANDAAADRRAARAAAAIAVVAADTDAVARAIAADRAVVVNRAAEAIEAAEVVEAVGVQEKMDFFEFLRKKDVPIWGGKGSGHTDEGEALCATLKRAWREFRIASRDSSPFSIQFGFDYYTEVPERVLESLLPGRYMNILLNNLIASLIEIRAGSSGDIQKQVAIAFNENSNDLVNALMDLQKEVAQSSLKEKFLVQRRRYITQVSKHEGGYKEGIIPLEYVNEVYNRFRDEYAEFRTIYLCLIKDQLSKLLAKEVLAVVLK